MFKKRLSIRIGGVFMIGLVLATPLSVFAYPKNNVLTDRNLTDRNAMSANGIQRFLEKKGSGLAGLRFAGLEGVQKLSSEIIYDASQYWNISSKYLLVRLQVEQGLVTNSTPSQRQLDFATGYGCPDGSGCGGTYSGFFNQVNWAARVLQSDRYLEGIRSRGYTISGWGPGITKETLDGISITPDNAATAALYTYTPWVGKYGGGDQRFGGTSLIWKTWQDWFSRKYPDGALLQASDSGGVYLIQNGKKRPFWSRSALLLNYDPKQIIIVSPTDLDLYDEGSPIIYANNTLLQGPNGAVYLISRGKKRGILSRDIFRQIGFNPQEIIPASQSELDSIPNGELIGEDAIYPVGVLLQSKTTGGIVYVENGVRHSIWSPDILYSRYRYRPVIQVTDSEIEQYRTGDPILFRDGELVTSPGSSSVFVISRGNKRPIDSLATFEALGYRWENLIVTSDKALEIHPNGTPLTLE